MRPVAAAAVVTLRGNEVLLIRRGQPPRSGSWSFPGGAIEAGETARQAAEREALEETGLRVEAQDVVDVYDAIFPAGPGDSEFHYCVADYLACPLDARAEPQPGDDAVDACWADLSDLAAFSITDAMERVIRRAAWLRDRDRPAPIGLEDRDLLPRRRRGSFTEVLHGALYVITRASPGRPHAEVAREALAGGARVIQLRDKSLDGGDLLSVAKLLRSMTMASGALFLVNDRVDVAIASAADGVHLGQTDIPLEAAREMLGPAACIGVSVESVEQAVAAQSAGASYLGVGDIFGTTSKPDAGAPVGIHHLRSIREVTELPIVAIGGISVRNLHEVRRSGADAVAVISAVADAVNMKDAARDLADLCASAPAGDSTRVA